MENNFKIQANIIILAKWMMCNSTTIRNQRARERERVEETKTKHKNIAGQNERTAVQNAKCMSMAKYDDMGMRITLAKRATRLYIYIYIDRQCTANMKVCACMRIVWNADGGPWERFLF